LCVKTISNKCGIGGAAKYQNMAARLTDGPDLTRFCLSRAAASELAFYVTGFRLVGS
jgi:hypothetical protein